MKFKKYYTDTDSLTSFPALIQASGENLVDYTITGNTGGVGDMMDYVHDVLINNLTDKTPQEANGLTITVSDGTISIDGTASTTTQLWLVSNSFGASSSSYQALATGKYLIEGNPLDAAENKYILSYRYDPDTPGSGTPSQNARVSIEGSEIDNTGGAYSYVAMYIVIWSGVVCSNVVFRPRIKGQGYAIPITSAGIVTKIPVTAPLGLTDTLTYTQTGIAIPTFDGDNTISFGTTVQPSGMSAEFKGWHSQDTVRVYNNGQWD